MQIPGSLKVIVFSLASTALLSAGPFAGPGYLARIGPSPLRFKIEAHGNPAVLLPRLKMSDDDEPNAKLDAETKNANAAHAVEAEGLRDPAEDFQDLPGDLAVAPGEFPPPKESSDQPRAAAGQAIIAPQTLLRYFDHATNRATTIISVPVEFTPPGAAAPRSSSATYISPP